MATNYLELHEFLETEVVDVNQINANSVKIDDFAGKAVTTDAQTFTEAEKVQIKSNIGVAAVEIVQVKGTSTTAVMSQKAVSDTIADELSGVYTYRGVKALLTDLDGISASVGDVYYITETSLNYAFDGTKFDPLAGSIDLSQYALKTELPKMSELMTQADYDALATKDPDTYYNIVEV